MSAATVLMRLRGVGLRYGQGVVALEGLDLELGAHERLALLGPSGCGKSSALRVMAGLLAPSAGSVEPARLAEPPGFVFQEPTLMPWASVAANVGLPLRLQGLPRLELDARVAEALAQVGLDGFAQALPHELSGGMKMRASIARALVTRPRLLLMDEPFAALDEITRMQLNDELLAVWRQQRFAMVFVTHSVHEAVYLSQRVLVLGPRPGRLVGELPIDDGSSRDDDPRGEPFRRAPAFHAQCVALSAQLQAGAAGASMAAAASAHGPARAPAGGDRVGADAPAGGRS